MWRFTLLLFSLVVFYGITVLSQQSVGSNYPDNPLRIEIPTRSANETYRIIPCGVNGLILFFRSQEPTVDGKINWYFTCYDTNFQQKWVNNVPMNSEHDYRYNRDGTDTLALLFVQGSKSKNPENSFEILRIVQSTGTMILNNGILEPGSVVDAFSVQKGRAWLGVNIKDQAGKIVNMELKQGITRPFSLGVGNRITLLWMQPDTSSLFISAIVGRQISKKINEYYLVQYDTNGSIKHESLIGTQSGERTLTRVQGTGLNNGSAMLLGSYGQGLPNSTNKNRPVEVSTGFFASTIQNGSQKSISYYNFLELQNASSIVGEEDMMNLKKKALRKNKSLSEYSLDYSVLLHDIFFYNDQYILTAEFFSPQYHTESFTDFDFYGRPYTNNYSVFDGYRFYDAVVAGFDLEGKLLWDNYIEIRNMVSFDLSPKVIIYPSVNNLVLCYVSDGKIGSKIIQENRVVEKLDFTAIDLFYPEDKLLSENKGTLLHWYGNYFLSFGYQEIKNIAMETNNKRLVFYFSKLRFDQ
ncbi:MAG: hypothetical protein Q8M08_03850 [Bacteroidales bacterium]|nr:hypothetical protein [Bacteroidales bacterium]